MADALLLPSGGLVRRGWSPGGREQM